ncbi:MAG: hypothetical protein ABI901_04700, partial [Roseiflexaceae bacterium]
PRLNQRLQALGYAVARSDHAPTQQSYELFAYIAARADRQLALLRQVLDTDLVEFNRLYAQAGFSAVAFSFPAVK